MNPKQIFMDTVDLDDMEKTIESINDGLRRIDDECRLIMSDDEYEAYRIGLQVEALQNIVHTKQNDLYTERRQRSDANRENEEEWGKIDNEINE